MKYQNKLCDYKMSFEDYELAILRNAVDRNELKTNKKVVDNPEISKIIKILESFQRKKKLVWYGGTAISNILPKKSLFYDKSVEIPGYDFYYPTH